MIIKLVGSAMIIISCLATSRMLSSLEKERADRLDAFIALIRYIRHRIDCYSLPIDKIFSECPHEMLAPLGGKEEGLSFDILLERKDIAVSDEGMSILREFSNTLGKTYRERQLKLCDGALSSLEALREIEKKQIGAKRKTVNALCLAVGGMLVLLLL